MENQAQNSILEWVVRSTEPEERVEMARAFEELRAHKAWGFFAQILDQRIQEQQRVINWPNGIPTYEELVSRTALLRGLLTARGIPEVVAEAGRRADDELRQIAEALERASA